MKKVNLTTKEIDAIECMIEYFLNNDDGFITRYHKRFSQKELSILEKKLDRRLK